MALDNNQVRSVNLMINYICKFQNQYVYAHLFEYNLVDLINKGVDMTNLFNSNVLRHEFDIDEWPPTSADTSKILAPYNLSIFKLRTSYYKIFSPLHRQDMDKKKDP